MSLPRDQRRVPHPPRHDGRGRRPDGPEPREDPRGHHAGRVVDWPEHRPLRVLQGVWGVWGGVLRMRKDENVSENTQTNPFSRAGRYERAYRAIPKWRRELRLLRRDGPSKYVRLAWKLHRFHRSVKRMERLEGRDAP